jgi:nanoRNase/pAp phosphatase (c-di-AMP/oligoRNAs hydrolase)
MKTQKIVVVLIGVMLLFAGKASAQQVKTDYDRGANFAQYKTYSWEHVKTQDPLDVNRIKNAVNTALTAKGWTQVDSGGDVSIVAVEMTRDQQTLNTFYNGFGGGWGGRRFGGGGFGDATTTTETYKVGSVVVDLFDTKTKQLIWRGTTSDTLSNNSEKNIKNLDKGVEKMFKNFPPGSSKK